MDKIFVISRIIKVEEGFISRSQRLRLVIMLPRPWLFWISQKPNLIIVLLHIDRKKMVTIVRGTDNLFLNVLKCKNQRATQNAREFDMITVRNRVHTWHDYPWPWVSLTWSLYNLLVDDVPRADFENTLYAFGQSE